MRKWCSIIRVKEVKCRTTTLEAPLWFPNCCYPTKSCKIENDGQIFRHQSSQSSSFSIGKIGNEFQIFVQNVSFICSFGLMQYHSYFMSHKPVSKSLIIRLNSRRYAFISRNINERSGPYLFKYSENTISFWLMTQLDRESYVISHNL